MKLAHSHGWPLHTRVCYHLHSVAVSFLVFVRLSIHQVTVSGYGGPLEIQLIHSTDTDSASSSTRNRSRCWGFKMSEIIEII